jgi:hypothetical protein
MENRMNRFAPLGVLLVALAGISGCANNSPDGLIKQQIALVNEQSDAIEKNAPESTLAAIKVKQDDLKKKLEALKLSAEEKKKVMEQNKEAITKATQRLIAVSMKKLGGDMKGMFDKKGK